MDERNEQLLINYFDRTLEEKEMREVEALIKSDTALQKQWKYLQLAVEAVEYAALYDQVASVKENFRNVQPIEVIQASNNAVRKRIRLYPLFSAAAILFVLVVGVFLFKYFTVSATQVYNEAFISYTLPTTRGLATVTDLEQQYRLQNWNGVIATIYTTSLVKNKALFLTGIAHLQLKHYAEARNFFKQVQHINSQNGDSLFQDEAGFYLAMTELANKNTKQAVYLLEQIQADKNHVYNKQAASISNIDLLILKMKAD